MGNLHRPVIGINVDLSIAQSPHEEQIQVSCGYVDMVQRVDGLPIIIPPYGKVDLIESFLDHVDAFMLLGGADVDTTPYGMPAHPALQPMNRRRQEHDALLLSALHKRRLPLLAIGVGMQQLNIALGGSVYMHLPEDQPSAFPHCDTGEDGQLRHAVEVLRDTRMFNIYGDGELLVNSCHHQAVHELGSDLRVCAKAPDGIIEAIEHVDATWFCIGVQWHPEQSGASALDRQLLDALIQASGTQEQDSSIAA